MCSSIAVTNDGHACRHANMPCKLPEDFTKLPHSQSAPHVSNLRCKADNIILETGDIMRITTASEMGSAVHEDRMETLKGTSGLALPWYVRTDNTRPDALFWQGKSWNTNHGNYSRVLRNTTTRRSGEINRNRGFTTPLPLQPAYGCIERGGWTTPKSLV